MIKQLLIFIWCLGFSELGAQTFTLVTDISQIEGGNKYIFASFFPSESGNNNVYVIGPQIGTKREVVKTDIIGVLDAVGSTNKIPNTLSLSDVEFSYFGLEKKSSGLWKLIDLSVRDLGDDMCYLTMESKTTTGIILGKVSDSYSNWEIEISLDGRANISMSGFSGQLRVNYKFNTLGRYTSFQNSLYIFKYEGEYTPGPILTASRSSIQFYVPKGGRQTENIGVSGKYLTGDVSIKVSGSGFSVNKNSIFKDEAGNASVAVTYTGETNSTGTLTLESEGCSPVEVALNAEIIEESADFKFSSSEGHSYLAGVSSTYGTYPTLSYRGEEIVSGAVKYTSSDESVATVDAVTGRVTAHSVGNCKITAELLENGLKAYYQLYVTDKLYVRLTNVGDITSGEYVLVGQKAEDSFGVFDIDKGFNVNNDKYFEYQKSFSSLPDVLWDKYSVVNIKATFKSDKKYCELYNNEDKYISYSDGDNNTNVVLQKSNYAISFLVNIEDGRYSLSNNNRYLAPSSGTGRGWKMYTAGYVFNNGSCLYLYRQALHVSSVTGRKLVLAGEWNSDVFSSIMDGCPEAAWIDLTSVTGMPNNVTLPSRENCIYVVTRDAFEKLKNTSNVVCEGKAEKIELTDGERPFCAYESFTATKVSYNRNFSGTTSTICLPFSCDIPDGAEVYEMTAFNDGHTVEFAKAASIEAYKPYIIRTTGIAFLNLQSGKNGNYTFPAEPEEMSVSYDALSFCGTMSRQELRSDEFSKYYGYSSGKLQYVGIGNVGYVNPFRAYFVERSADDLRTVDIVLYDVPASIESTEVGMAGFVDVYSIDGRLIKASVEEKKATDGLDKGIYIIGKRKVLVK